MKTAFNMIAGCGGLYCKGLGPLWIL